MKLNPCYCCAWCLNAGESDPIKKSPDEDPWVRSGTQVSEGSGRLLIIATGTYPVQMQYAVWQSIGREWSYQIIKALCATQHQQQCNPGCALSAVAGPTTATNHICGIGTLLNLVCYVWPCRSAK